MNSRRRFRSPVAWALALVVGAPVLAQAQQSGLFPLAPIRRERVPCPMEDPVYKLYRHEYYGYFPTCWRRFPDGWGCPSPEAPNVAESFRQQPLDKPSTLAPVPGEEPGAAPGMAPGAEPGAEETPPAIPGRPGGGTSPLPPLPRERSPFDIDTGAPPPGPTTTPPGPTTPGVTPPAESTKPAPRGAGPIEPTRPSTGVLGPVEVPGPPVPTQVETKPAAPTTGTTEPLLALPDPSAPPSPTSPAAGSAMLPSPTLPASGAVVVDPAGNPGVETPTQAPPRRSMIGSLLGGLRWHR